VIDDGSRPVDTGSPKLDAFFTAAVEFARGRLSPEAFSDKVGPSKSGLKRLGLYPNLVKFDNRAALNKMYEAAQRVVERHRVGLWDRWIDEFQAKNAARDWRIRLMCDGFFDFVKEKRALDPHIPQSVEELVDLAWSRSAAMCAAPAVDDDVMDKTVYVRHYTHAVPAFFVAIADGKDAESPAPTPSLTIIYRSLLTLRPRFYHPNIPGLLALARRTNTATELLAQFKHVSDEMIDEGEASLVEHGVLAPRP
jgi:hypothetical protein